MRGFIIASTALAVFGFSVPVVGAAQAEDTVVIKRDHDRDRHRDWHRDRDERRVYIERHHDHRWRRDHDHD